MDNLEKWSFDPTLTTIDGRYVIISNSPDVERCVGHCYNQEDATTIINNHEIIKSLKEILDNALMSLKMQFSGTKNVDAEDIDRLETAIEEIEITLT